MTKTTKLSLASAAVILGTSLTTGLLAQNTSVTPSDNTGRYHLNANNSGQGLVNNANKASSLIGMDVRNLQNEKLGDIKDLVVDLPSGKISYAVLSVGGFLGIGDKYIAVPPSAFSLAPDGKDLVLNADKAKIQSAPGFAKNDWPDPKNPAWATHSAYWESGTAQGGPGTVRSGSQSMGGSAMAHETFHGTVTAVDTKANTLTVQGPAGNREFKLDNHSTITLGRNGSNRLSDLKVGYPVTVGYRNDNGTFIAQTITRSDMPETK